jgi:hypothetical protein
VTQPAELVSARPRHRPTYLSATLGGLFTAHPPVAHTDGAATVGRWRASLAGDEVRVERWGPGGDAAPADHTGGAGDIDDWWRVLATAAWRHLDTTGRVADVARLTQPGA